jgi:hypothetical protein
MHGGSISPEDLPEDNTETPMASAPIAIDDSGGGWILNVQPARLRSAQLLPTVARLRSQNTLRNLFLGQLEIMLSFLQPTKTQRLR